MARTVTVESKAGNITEGYAPLTEEQKRLLDAAGQRLAFETREGVEGDTFEFPCTIKVGDSEMYSKKFQGVQGPEKPHRRITVTLTGALAPLDFWTMSADNVQNDKTLLNKLYKAVKREAPPERGTFTYDPDDLEVDNLLVVLAKGNARTDGRRGGFFFNIVGFKRPRQATSNLSYEEFMAQQQQATPAAPKEDSPF